MEKPSGLHPRTREWFSTPKLRATPLGRRQIALHSALLHALDARGHFHKPQMENPRAIACRIADEWVGCSIHESMREERVALTPKEIKDPANAHRKRPWKKVMAPSGELMLLIETPEEPRTKSRNWSDTKKMPLEDQLPAIVDAFEEMAKDAAERREERIEEQRRERERWREIEKLQAEERREYEREDELRELAADWREAERIRAFLDAVEARLATQSNPPAVVMEWVAWARDYVEGLDPLAGEGLDNLVAVLDPPDDGLTEEEW